MKVSCRFIIIVTIIVLLIFVGGKVTYKVITNYRHNILLVTEKRIIEAAKKCFDEDQCTSYPISLKQLYEDNYLDKQINPLTKEVYSENSNVTYEEEKLVFKPIY